jgi:hypothetical protein
MEERFWGIGIFDPGFPGSHHTPRSIRASGAAEGAEHIICTSLSPQRFCLPWILEEAAAITELVFFLSLYVDRESVQQQQAGDEE